jgi:hypothetical protein
VALSDNEITTLHDLVISQSDSDNGLVSLAVLKKNRSRHLSFGWSSLAHRDPLPRVSAGSYFLVTKLLYLGNLRYPGSHGV